MKKKEIEELLPEWIRPSLSIQENSIPNGLFSLTPEKCNNAVVLWRKIMTSREFFCKKCTVVVCCETTNGYSEVLDMDTVMIPCFCGNVNKFKVSEHL